MSDKKVTNIRSLPQFKYLNDQGSSPQAETTDVVVSSQKQRPTIKHLQLLEPTDKLNIYNIRGVGKTLQVGDHLLHGHLHEKQRPTIKKEQ